MFKQKIGCWRSDPNFPKKWCWPIVKFLIGTQNFTWWAAGIAKCPECACKKKGCADCGTYKHTYDCLQVARLNDGDVFRPKLADKPGSNNIKYMQNEHRFVRCEDPDLHNYGYRFDPTGADIQVLISKLVSIQKSVRREHKKCNASIAFF